MLDTEVSRAYKAAVRHLLQTVGACHRWTGALLLELDFFRPRRTGDLANGEKALSDGLQTETEELRNGELRTHPGLFEDDGQTVEMRLRRFEDKEYPRVQVTVRLVPGPSGPPPERWAPPPGWEQAQALVEAAQEKRRERQRKKRESKAAAPAQASSPAYRQALPAGSSPGTRSYGSQHWPQGLPKRKSKAELAALAKPASYRPLPAQARQATLDTASNSAKRGKHDD